MMSRLMNRPSPPARWVLLDRHAWALVVALALPALIPTLMPGWFEGHDDLHIYRLIEYDRALRDGQVPPRWFPDISAGYGNPHPIYYAPLFYLTAETFHLAGLDVILSLKAAIVVFTLLVCGGWMYARTIAELSFARGARRNDDYPAAEEHLAACRRLPRLPRI